MSYRRNPPRDCTIAVARVEDDPDRADHVIVTTAGRSRANMTARAFLNHYRLAADTEVLSTRLIRWDG